MDAVSVLQPRMQANGPSVKAASERSLLKAKARDTKPGANLKLQDVPSRAVKGAVEETSKRNKALPETLPVSVGFNSPTLRINDHSPDERDCRHSTSPLMITNFSESPYHISSAAQLTSHSPVQDFTDEDMWKCPSSPLLTAMREAVDSLAQYEDFEIIEKIGAGFFAEVFKVRHITTDEIMVLKINKRMNGVRKRNEVELLKKLSHPNILHYMGACVHEGQLHPITEYVNGGTLEALIQNSHLEFPWSLRLQLALDMAKGMEYLHQHGMLHRDLNSKNCLLRKEGSKYTAVVADFGLAAREPHLLRTLTRSQSVVGNPYWMAPEVLNGKPYNKKVDVFSYGIILCELISRLEADPEEIPRSKDFGLDQEKFRNLPVVSNSKCPKEFLELAFLCCRFIPVERPTFTDIKTRLSIIIVDLYSDHQTESSNSSGLPPRPSQRLSSHEVHYHRSRHSPSPGPRETVV